MKQKLRNLITDLHHASKLPPSDIRNRSICDFFKRAVMLGLQEDKQKGVIYTQIETEFELSSILNLWFSDPGQGIDILIVVELGKNPLNTTVMIDRERIDEDAEEV